MYSAGTSQTVQNYFNAAKFRNRILNLLSLSEIKACIYFSTHDQKNLKLERALNVEGNRQEVPVTPGFKDLINARQKVEIKKAAGKDGEAITLKRIALVFPEMTVELLSIHQENFKLTPLEDLRRITKLDSYPSIARHQACAAIIPQLKIQRQDRIKALAAIILPHVLLAEKQNKSKEVNNIVMNEIVTDSRLFVWKSYTSVLFADDTRIKLSKEHGIMCDGDEEGKVVLSLTEQWRKAGDAAYEILREKYKLTKMLGPPRKAREFHRLWVLLGKAEEHGFLSRSLLDSWWIFEEIDEEELREFELELKNAPTRYPK